jgi:hypothetical protein
MRFPVQRERVFQAIVNGDDDVVPASMIMKTAMGIAPKIWRHRLMRRFLARVYAPL